MARVNMFIMMVKYILETGKKICSTVRVLKLCLMEELLVECSREDEREVMEYKNGLMIQLMKVTGRMEKLKDKVHMSGQIKEHMLESGAKTSSMVKENTLGLMDVNTKESMTWIRNMGMVLLTGLMVESMKVSGSMDNNMDRVN
jgi:hypothetical protein